jgi:high-affinity nickel-transport protein
MTNSRPTSSISDSPETRSSFLRNVSKKASAYHSRVPYLSKLPFPAIAIIVILIVVNLLTWAAVGIVLVPLENPFYEI